MEYKEAIEVLQDYLCAHSSGTLPSTEKLDKAICMMCDAMEKQIVKKPIIMNNRLLLDAGWKYACPTCGCAVGENRFNTEITQDDEYCSCCGQKLHWNRFGGKRGIYNI